MRSILYYITGHGYGHAVRSNQVIRALKRAAADLQIHVRTAAPEWLFHDAACPVRYTDQPIDVGLIQPNSLQMDLRATFQACRDLHSGSQRLVEQEIRFIKEQKIDLILGDIPPLCFEIAARADRPSVAITNFTWDTIYRAYTAEQPEFAALIKDMKQFYSKACLALTLPYPCDMSMFEKRQAIPWITRVSKSTREQARRRFGLPTTGTVVLLSFGGLGLETLPWHKLRELSDFFFVTTGTVKKAPGNLLVLADTQRRYEDLLRAVDVIVTKPGYGIVADVLSHQLPILYTDRGEFPEYPLLVQALNELATAEHIPQVALLAGDLRPYLEKILAKPHHWPAIPLDGATVAADEVLALLDDARL